MKLFFSLIATVVLCGVALAQPQQVNHAPTTTTSVVVAPYTDIAQTGTITAQDTGSTATTQANGQVVYTGTPTPYSTITLSGVSGQPTALAQTVGIWTGTIQFERSYDGGTTWYASGGKAVGVAVEASTFTSNQTIVGSAAVATNIRIRAVSAMTGTLTGLVKASVAPGYLYTTSNIASIGGQAVALSRGDLTTNAFSTLNTFSSGGEATNTATTTASALTLSGGGDPAIPLCVIVTNNGSFDVWVSPISGGHTWLCPAGATTYILAGSTNLYVLANGGTDSACIYCIKAGR